MVVVGDDTQTLYKKKVLFINRVMRRLSRDLFHNMMTNRARHNSSNTDDDVCDIYDVYIVPIKSTQ